MPRGHRYMHEVRFERIPHDGVLAAAFAQHGVRPAVELPPFERVASHQTLLSPLDFDFHTKHTFVAGSIHDPAILPFIQHMCAGHPLGGFCARIAEGGLDIPSFFKPWGGTFFNREYPERPSPPKARFRNSGKCSAVCADGTPGWDFIRSNTMDSWRKGVIAFVRTDPQILNGLTLEPTKPRVCMASVWLNLWCVLPYQLHFGGLKALTDVLTALSMIVTFDAIQAFNHISLTERSLPYACFQVPGLPLACYLCMWFGWRPASHVMQAFAVVVADYIRVHHSIPVAMHIDDGALCAPSVVPGHGQYDGLTEVIRFRVTCNAAYIVLCVFQSAGWCIGLPKSSVLPEACKKHLGMLVHCPSMSYRIPDDKRLKYRCLLAPLIGTPLGEPLPCVVLRSFLGFMIFLSIACPPLKTLSKFFHKAHAVMEAGGTYCQTDHTLQRLRFLRVVLVEFSSSPWLPPARATLFLGAHDSSMHTAGAWLRLPEPQHMTAAQRCARRELLEGHVAADDPHLVFVSCPIPESFLHMQIDAKEYYSLLCILLVLLQNYKWVIQLYRHIVIAGDNMHVYWSQQRDGKGSVDMLAFAEEVMLAYAIHFKNATILDMHL